MRYFFIFGNHPELSRDEIFAKVGRGLNSVPRPLSLTSAREGFLLLETDQSLDLSKLITELAGTVKVGEIVGELDGLTPEALAEKIPGRETIINFGISPYNLKLNENKLGLGIKKFLRGRNIKARFVSSKISPLSSVIVQKNLLGKGIELVLLKTAEGLLLGETKAVQPFETFSEIDFGRPNRDAKSGMLPPKLAQMMINLAEVEPTRTLLDPFCGSGTVLQQALYIGFNDLIGADASEKAINDTRQNLDWFKKRFNLQDKQVKLYKTDISGISRVVPNGSVDAIVTEPWLGPPLRGRETDRQITANLSALTSLYKQALEKFSLLLRRGGAVVIVAPEFNLSPRRRVDIPSILPKNLQIIGSWQYARPDQLVMRNIFKIKKIL